MKHRLLVVAALAASTVSSSGAQGRPEPPNPSIDMEGFLRVSARAAEHRRSRRLSEEEFILLSRARGTVVLDARSPEMYDLLHVRGAINLSFPDITFESLERTIPDKKTRILIYCNNNFRNAPEPFPTKKESASLNLSTYVALFDYGYTNVYELGPLLDPATSKLDFVSSSR
jgi:hypothetical protein